MLGDLTSTVGRSLGWLLTPATLCLIALVTTGILLLRRGSRGARILGGSACVIAVLLAWYPLPTAIIAHLERVPGAVDWTSVKPGELTGVIVLGGGGAIPGSLTEERGSVQLNAGAERITTAAAMAHRDPRLLILVSGGWAALVGDGPGEADAMTAFLAEQSISGPRVISERGSRNTRENAARTAPIVASHPGRWGLITSATHMTRAQAEFTAAGVDVVPLPVDYQTGTAAPRLIGFDPTAGLNRWSLATYEVLARVQQALAGLG